MSTKRIIEESETVGVDDLLGETIIVMCMNYTYSGILVSASDDAFLLRNPEIVFKTGPFKEPGWERSEPTCCSEQYIARSAIESYGKIKGSLIG